MLLLSFTLLTYDHNMMLFDSILLKLKNIIIQHYPPNVIQVLKVSENISKKLYEKDCYEAIGFQNGYAPYTDLRAVGLLGPLVIVNFFERLEMIYI